MSAIEIHKLTQQDFDAIHRDLADFWGRSPSEATVHAHHPMFLHEFGDTSYVIRENGQVAAYLFGFLAQAYAGAYVQFIGVRPAYRKRGLARALYAHFAAEARARGARKLKAITRPDNADSIAFHRKLGMTLAGKPNEQGLNVMRDYSRPGEDRVVFEMSL